AVEGLEAREPSRGERAAAGDDHGHPGAGDARGVTDDGGVADQDARDVGEGVAGARRPVAEDDAEVPEAGPAHRGVPAQSAPRKRSVAATSASVIPGSMTWWPASGTITSSASGHARESSQALMTGHTTS